MAITPDQARRELAKRELARRESLKSQPSFLDKAVSAVSPLTGALQKFGEITQPVRESVAYSTSPQGLLEGGYSQLSNLAGKAGELATEELGKRGANPHLAALAGLGITFAPDILAGLTQPASPAFGRAATQATERAAKGVAKSFLPRTFKSTAGVPEQATEALINDPSILKRRFGTDASVATEMKRVQGLVQSAKTRIGNTFGKIYKRYAEMEGPMQELEQTPIAQKVSSVETKRPVINKETIREQNPFTGALETREIDVPSVVSERKIVGKGLTTVPRKTHSFDEIIINKNLADEAFSKGDTQMMGALYKEYVGGTETNLREIKITNTDKLKILTRLKREIQQQAEFNKDPITLRPIDTAKDAAFKKMASEIDDLRSELPNGEKLALADDAYSEIRDIYRTIQRDLADPGKARDTFARILKGDQTWLTAGKFQNKINAIKRVEKLTGQQILKPAQEELTSLIFKEKSGKGIAYNAVPAAAFGYALSQLFSGRIGQAAITAAGAGVALAAGSPRVLGKTIQGAARAGNFLNTGVNLLGTQAPRIGLGLGQRRRQE